MRKRLRLETYYFWYSSPSQSWSSCPIGWYHWSSWCTSQPCWLRDPSEPQASSSDDTCRPSSSCSSSCRSHWVRMWCSLGCSDSHRLHQSSDYLQAPPSHWAPLSIARWRPWTRGRFSASVALLFPQRNLWQWSQRRRFLRQWCFASSGGRQTSGRARPRQRCLRRQLSWRLSLSKEEQPRRLGSHRSCSQLAWCSSHH